MPQGPTPIRVISIADGQPDPTDNAVDVSRLQSAPQPVRQDPLERQSTPHVTPIGNIQLPEEPEPGFIDNLELDKRKNLAIEIAKAELFNEQSTSQTLFQLAGKVGAPIVFDVLGEGGAMALRGARAVLPDGLLGAFMPNVEETLPGRVAREFLESDVAQQGLNLAAMGLEKYEGWAKEHPVAARNVESLVNLELLLSPAKRNPTQFLADRSDVINSPVDVLDAVNPTTQSINILEGGVRDTARAVTASGERSAGVARERFIDDLLTPKRPTPTEGARQAAAGQREAAPGPFSTERSVVSERDREIRGQISTIEGVKPTNLYQKNINVIRDEIGVEAEALESMLKALPTPEGGFTRFADVKARIRESAETLKGEILAFGNSPTTIDNLAGSLIKHISKQKNSNPHSWLMARRDFDTEVTKLLEKNKGSPELQSAAQQAARSLRRELNELIEPYTAGASRESLRRQTLMYDAIDILAPKAFAQKDTFLGRVWSGVTTTLGLKSQIHQAMALAAGGMATGMTITGLGPIALGAAGTYGVLKGIQAPAARKWMGKLLEGNAQAIAALRTIRADRAMIPEAAEQTAQKLREMTADQALLEQMIEEEDKQ